jgi:very-short-patch-repair endonuclease
MASSLESKFALYWRVIQGPPLVPEHRFHPIRKWRFDFAHPAARVAVELEGGIWSGGRHTRGAGYKGDCEKYNEATLGHWAIFRLTSVHSAELERIADFIRLREKIFAESPSK